MHKYCICIICVVFISFYLCDCSTVLEFILCIFTENLLMRYVDDYLLLTHEEGIAHEFLLSLLSPEVTAEYNCTVKHEKTVSNITPPLGVQLEQVCMLMRRLINTQKVENGIFFI